MTENIVLIILNLVPQVKVLSGKYRHNTSNYWELGFALCAGNAEMGLLCQNHMQSMKKRTDLAESQGVYCGTRWDRKENQLEELHIDYRRILDFVEKGDLIRDQKWILYHSHRGLFGG